MANPIRAELLSILAELSSACPEMRIGQLISNLSTLAKGLSAEDLWNIEDAELLQAARRQLAYFVEHRDLARNANPAGHVTIGSNSSSTAR